MGSMEAGEAFVLNGKATVYCILFGLHGAYALLCVVGESTFRERRNKDLLAN